MQENYLSHHQKKKLLVHPAIFQLFTMSSNKSYIITSNKEWKNPGRYRPSHVIIANKIIWMNGNYALFQDMYIKNKHLLPSRQCQVLGYPEPIEISRYKNIQKFTNYVEEFLNVDKAVCFWTKESYFPTLHKKWKMMCTELLQSLPSSKVIGNSLLHHGTQKMSSIAPANSAMPCSKKMMTDPEECSTEASSSTNLPSLKLRNGFYIKIIVNNKMSQSPSASGFTDSEADILISPLNISMKPPSSNTLHHWTI